MVTKGIYLGTSLPITPKSARDAAVTLCDIAGERSASIQAAAAEAAEAIEAILGVDGIEDLLVNPPEEEGDHGTIGTLE